MFDNDRVVEKVFSGPFVNDLRKALAGKTGLRLMVIGNTGGWRNIANSKHEVRTPEDLKGLKLRTINSQVQIRLAKLLGASATPIAWPELYTSLATGVVDGSKNGITDIVGMKFHEYVKYITLDGHAYMAALWLINKNFFLQLSPDERKIVADGFEALRNVTIAFPKRRQITAYDTFKKAGGKIYSPTKEEKALFVSAAQPLKQWYVKKFGRQWLDKLEKAIQQAKAELDAEYAVTTN
ncbi:MAG: hypothetical protein GY874_11990 [Desulfobacteraceae bacterium]|nr:hypothetical protein [Desulfobacteraceae bacterium]